MLEHLGGRVKSNVKKKKLPDGRTEEQITEETEGGILHWGRENSEDLNWFREKIREAYGGRAPKVLDPFAGGGAIPLEAMRLGCEVTAVDINPVAWFILKCTLEYPQRFANQCHPLPEFALQSHEFMESYFKAKGFKNAALRVQLESVGLNGQEKGTSQPQLPTIRTDVVSVEADLAWHVRAWGWWVLQRAKADLEHFYPTINGKPTVAYLWARTVTCKNCRATVPLLKTRWLCKKDKKRVVLTMEPNADKTGVIFDVQNDVPLSKGTPAQRREYDKRVGAGTMSGSGVTCPCCGTIIRMEDIRLEGQTGRLGAVMTAVVVDGRYGKEYRLPTEEEIHVAAEAGKAISDVFAFIPFCLPEEPVPKGGSGASRAFSVDGYGLDRWYKLFTLRQLLALGTFVKYTRAVREVMRQQGCSEEWVEAVSAYLAAATDRMTDRLSTGATWDNTRDGMSHVFHRFALPIVWDFGEANPFSDAGGGFAQQLVWVTRYIEHAVNGLQYAPVPHIFNQSATGIDNVEADIVVTDPPYYDAIPYRVM